MELVTSKNADKLDALTQNRGRLNIPKGSPKIFTFGTIIENAEDLVEAQNEGPGYTICVFRVGTGKSYVHKYIDEEIGSVDSIPPKEGYDSIYLENP
jgi:hypothetical protein